MCGIKEVHLTNASIPGVRCLREMNASTNKRRRDITYTSKVITKTGIRKHSLEIFKFGREASTRGNRKAIPVRTAEETRHSIASSLDGKLKNHPIQCIPPNTTPTTDVMTAYATSFMSSVEVEE